MPDSIIKTILDGNLAELKQYMEEKIGEKINQKIEDRKVSILAKMNGTTEEEMREQFIKNE